MRFKILFALLLVLSIGFSISISVDRLVITCDDKGVCQPVTISIDSGVGSSVYIVISGTEGLKTFGNYPKATKDVTGKTALNPKANVFASTATSISSISQKYTISPTVKPFSSGKYNITIYDTTTNKVLFELDPFWNTTFSNRINVNISTSYMTDTDVQTVIILNSTNWGNVSICQDTIYCNDSAVTFYNTTSSAEQPIAYYFERYNVSNTTSNTYLWVKMPEISSVATQVFIYFNSSTVTRSSWYNGTKVFLKFYDFENSTTVPADFGSLNGANTIETDGGYERNNYLKSTDDTVWGFSATRKNATMVAYIKAVGGDWGTYMGTNTGGTWAGSTANKYPIAQVTVWSRYVIDFSGSLVNYTINGNTYTLNGVADMGQTAWGYSTTGVDAYTDVLMLAKYLPLWTMTYAFSGVQSAPSGENTVALNYPNNGVTNTTNQIQFGYTPTFEVGNIQNCSLYTNESGWGINQKNGSGVANNSLNTITHNFSNSGSYLWNIACWNETNELMTSANRTLTLTEYLTGYPTTGYELNKYPFNISFSFGGFTYANIGLVYNHTYYAGSMVNVTTPFLLTNNSEVSFYWNYTRDGILKNTTTQTHNVTFAYSPDGSDWLSTTVLEGDSATAYLYGWNVSSLGTISMKLYDGTNNHTASGIISNSSVTFNVGAIPVASLGKNYTWYMMVSYSGLTRTMNATTINITITQFGLINCGSNPTLSYTTYDEQTWAYAIGSNYYARVDIWRGNVMHSYSKQVLDSPNIKWCITPASASFNANVSLLYGNTSDYPQRSWYWNNMVLNNVSQNISVYVLNTSHSFLTGIDVKNQIGIPQSNIIVLFQKFNYTENRYINMTNIYTTGTGDAFTYLEEFNTPYRILLYDRIGNLLNTYDNYFIKESPITLRTTMQFYSLFYYFNQMSATCSWGNTTRYLSCDWNDASGKLTKISWYAKENMLFQTTDICNETQTGTSGTFTCYLGALTGVQNVYYSLTAYIGDVGQLLISGNVNTITGLSGGKIANLDRNGGVILALFIVMFMFFIGIWKPALGIALGFAGFVLSIFLGLLDFGGAEFSIVGILLALTIFMVWRMRI